MLYVIKRTHSHYAMKVKKRDMLACMADTSLGEEGTIGSRVALLADVRWQYSTVLIPGILFWLFLDDADFTIVPDCFGAICQLSFAPPFMSLYESTYDNYIE